MHPQKVTSWVEVSGKQVSAKREALVEFPAFPFPTFVFFLSGEQKEQQIITQTHTISGMFLSH